MTFLHTLRRNCDTHAAKTAVRCHHSDHTETVTYGELDQQVTRTMAWLQALGVQPGDRVALQLPKCLPFLYLHLATLRLGAICLPLNTAYPPQELAYFLQDAEAAVFIADAARKDDLTPMTATMPFLRHTHYLDTTQTGAFTTQLPPDALQNDALPPANATALMIYTSGTTGRPKGALITHGNLTANIEGLHAAWGWRADDVLLHVLPIFHVHGLVVALHGALHAGATAVLLPTFDPAQTWRALVADRCTVFMAVPTIHRRMVDHPDAAQHDLSHVRLITSGSDRLPDDLFAQAQQVYGHTLLERYGMTETGMNLSNPLHGERRIGSVGLPLPGVEVRIVDVETEAPLPDGEVGAVQVRGPHVCAGYWRQPQKTTAAFTADGWLRTGDLGLRAPDGYITLKGRSKDLIISGGYNVYPPEVERVLAAHPAVAASAVIGCADDLWGERVTAVIVPQTDPTPSAAAIIDYCRQQLAAYKAPKQVIFVDALPRNALGKVQKETLRQQVCITKGGELAQQSDRTQ